MLLVSLINGEAINNPVQDIIASSKLWIIFIATVIIAPIGEELVFRRLVIDRTRRYGEGIAILVSALAFALFHMNLYQFFYAFLLGALFALIYVKTGRLIYTILLHAIVNFNGSVVALKILEISEKLTTLDVTNIPYDEIIPLALGIVALLLYSVLIFGSLIGSIVILCTSIRKIRLEKAEGGARILLQPTLIVFAALCLIMTVLTMIL